MPAATVQVEGDNREMVKSSGRSSMTVTLLAVEGPALVALMVYVSLRPARMLSALALWVMARSADGAVVVVVVGAVVVVVVDDVVVVLVDVVVVVGAVVVVVVDDVVVVVGARVVMSRLQPPANPPPGVAPGSLGVSSTT